MNDAHTTPAPPRAHEPRAVPRRAFASSRRLRSDRPPSSSGAVPPSFARARVRARRASFFRGENQADGVPFRHFGGKFGHPQAGQTTARGTPTSTAPNTARAASRLPTPGGGGAARAAFGGGGGVKSALSAFGGGGTPDGGFAAPAAGGCSRRQNAPLELIKFCGSKTQISLI